MFLRKRFCILKNKTILIAISISQKIVSILIPISKISVSVNMKRIIQ